MDSVSPSKSFGTHDGSFHADEVSACALLLVFGLIERSKIFRTRDPRVLEQCEYVCDVGGVYDPDRKRFDHHQIEYTGELSSAGMVWRYLLDSGLIEERMYQFINRSIIMGIDAHDNGKSVQQDGVATFSQIIANFVPVAYDASAEEQMKAFYAALEFTQGHFRRLLDRMAYNYQCRDKVADAMKSEQLYLLFNETIPWQENFFDLGGESHPALFVVMPSEGQWKLRCIPPNRENKMQVRLALPKEWAGLRDQQLRQVTGIEGAIFCHKGRFISVWKSKEDALSALNYVLKQL